MWGHGLFKEGHVKTDGFTLMRPMQLTGTSKAGGRGDSAGPTLETPEGTASQHPGDSGSPLLQLQKATEDMVALKFPRNRKGKAINTLKTLKISRCIYDTWCNSLGRISQSGTEDTPGNAPKKILLILVLGASTLELPISKVSC